MLRLCLIVTASIAVLCLPDSAESGERRNRTSRSWNESQGGQAQPAYGPVQRTNGLPYGRAYYGGRYFGNFNNRYYGPQYGYF